jgi:hypothetical protein
MEFRIPSTTKRRPRNAVGFKLVEFSIAMGIGSLVLLISSGLMVYSGRHFASVAGYTDLQSRTLTAIDRMSLEIRQFKTLSSYSSNSLTFNGTNVPVTYTYSPTKRTLVRVEGPKQETLLSECDFLEFHVYQRSPIPGSFEQNEVVSIDEAKVVAINWGCSRSLGGSMVTDNAQAARIVLRAN